MKSKFRYGYKFLARKPESVVIETPEGAQEEYEVLNVIEFTSTRKRMSVIVRDPRGRIRLLTKGPLMNDVSYIVRILSPFPPGQYQGGAESRVFLGN